MSLGCNCESTNDSVEELFEELTFMISTDTENIEESNHCNTFSSNTRDAKERRSLFRRSKMKRILSSS